MLTCARCHGTGWEGLTLELGEVRRCRRGCEAPGSPLRYDEWPSQAGPDYDPDGGAAFGEDQPEGGDGDGASNGC